jgi:hypothetical protein
MQDGKGASVIGTYANEKQLASIDGATSLGQIADDAVLAVLAWRTAGSLSARESEPLRLVAAWLERSVQSLTDPLHISLKTQSAQIPGLSSFGAGVAGLALGIDPGGQDPQSAVVALKNLRSSVLALVEGTGTAGDADLVQAAFDQIAQAMLSTADSLLAPAARTTWATTVSF